MSEANDAGAAEAPTGQEAEKSAFDLEFEAFIGHSFGDPNVDSAAAAPGGPVVVEPTSAAAAPDAAAAPASTNAEVPASANPPAADGTEVKPQDPVIEPADLAAMVGLATVKQAEPAPAVEPKAEPAPAPASSSPEEDAPWTPFTPTFSLPPEIVSALFEAEDTETRAKALVGILSAFGNTLTTVVDDRIAKHHLPRFQETTVARQSEAQTASAIFTDFYGKYPELDSYKPAVIKAYQVVSARVGVEKGYTPEIRDQVAQLAKAALKQSGVQFVDAAPGTAAPKEVLKAPPGKAPGSAFEAGSARPDGSIDNGDSGAADLVTELSQF